MWPTPNAEGGTGYMSGAKRDVWRPTLGTAVLMAPEGPPPLIRRSLMVPTPSASMFGCKDVPKMLARRERLKKAKKNGNGFGLTLGQWTALTEGGEPSPAWVEWLMGFPMGWTETAASVTP